MSMPFLQRGLDLLREGGHLVAGPAVEMVTLVDVLLPQGHAGGVDGRVAAADDAHVAPGQLLAPEVEGLEELRWTGRRPARPRPRGPSGLLLWAPERQEDGLVALVEQAVDGDVPAQQPCRIAR